MIEVVLLLLHLRPSPVVTLETETAIMIRIYWGWVQTSMVAQVQRMFRVGAEVSE